MEPGPDSAPSQRTSVLGWTFGLIRELIDEWNADRVGGLAAEIAFFALLGFFPAVIVLAAALGSVDGLLGVGAAEDMEAWIIDRIGSVLGGENVQATIAELFSGENGNAFTIGALIAAYAASRGFTAVVRALDVAYDHRQSRDWLSTRLVGFGLTLMSMVVAALLLVLIVVGPLFGEGAELAERLGVNSWFDVLWTWFRWPVVFLVLVLWTAWMYHWAPNHRSPWRYEIPGSLLASTWWTVVSIGFSSYLQLASGGVNAIFGLLGGAISLLFWLYLLAMGLLLGAEINSVIARRLGVLIDAPERPGLDSRIWIWVRRRFK